MFSYVIARRRSQRGNPERQTQCQLTLDCRVASLLAMTAENNSPRLFILHRHSREGGNPFTLSIYKLAGIFFKSISFFSQQMVKTLNLFLTALDSRLRGNDVGGNGNDTEKKTSIRSWRKSYQPLSINKTGITT